MSKNRLFGLIAGIIVAVVMLGASVHATAGAGHDASSCVVCALCEHLNALFN
jgi:hypothetical protein